MPKLTLTTALAAALIAVTGLAPVASQAYGDVWSRGRVMVVDRHHDYDRHHDRGYRHHRGHRDRHHDRRHHRRHHDRSGYVVRYALPYAYGDSYRGCYDDYPRSRLIIRGQWYD